MVLGGVLLYRRTVVVHSNFTGKAAALFLYGSVCLCFFSEQLGNIPHYFLGLSIVLAYIALGSYAWLNVIQPLRTKKLEL